MPEQKSFTCILCPRGCFLTVTVDGAEAEVRGNACPKGLAYGKQEAVRPLRTLTSTVRAEGSCRRRLPVRTNGDIELARLREAAAVLDNIVARAPVSCGDVLVADFLGLGVDLIATDDLPLGSVGPGGQP